MANNRRRRDSPRPNRLQRVPPDTVHDESEIFRSENIEDQIQELQESPGAQQRYYEYTLFLRLREKYMKAANQPTNPDFVLR